MKFIHEIRVLAFIVSVSILATFCAHQRPFQWPASVYEIKDFGYRKSLIEDMLIDFNTKTDNLSFTDSATGKSVITVRLVDGIPSNSSRYFVAGRASLSRNRCDILLSELVFIIDGINGPGLAKTVLWHEIGHCAGLGHVDEGGEIMSSSVTRWDNLNDGADVRFLEAFTKNINRFR